MNIVSDAEAVEPKKVFTRESITFTAVVFESFSGNFWQSVNLFNVVFNIGVLAMFPTSIGTGFTILAMSLGGIGLIYNFSKAYKEIEQSILYNERQRGGSISD